jgi:hypothetical protein
MIVTVRHAACTTQVGCVSDDTACSTTANGKLKCLVAGAGYRLTSTDVATANTCTNLNTAGWAALGLVVTYDSTSTASIAAGTIVSADSSTKTFTATTSFATAGFVANDEVVVTGTNCGATGTYSVASVSGTALVVNEYVVQDETTSGDCALSRTVGSGSRSVGALGPVSAAAGWHSDGSPSISPFAVTVTSVTAGTKTFLGVTSWQAAGYRAGNTVTVGHVTAIPSWKMTIASATASSKTFDATASFLAAGYAVGNTVVVGHDAGSNCDAPGTFIVTAISSSSPWTMTVSGTLAGDEATSGHCVMSRAAASSSCSAAGEYTVVSVSGSAPYNLVVQEAVSSESTSGDCTVQRDAAAPICTTNLGSFTVVGTTVNSCAAQTSVQYAAMGIAVANDEDGADNVHDQTQILASATTIVSASSSSKTFTATASFAAAGYVAGDTVVVGHSSGTLCATTGTFTVTAVATTSLTVTETVADEGNSGDCTMSRATLGSGDDVAPGTQRTVSQLGSVSLASTWTSSGTPAALCLNQNGAFTVSGVVCSAPSGCTGCSAMSNVASVASCTTCTGPTNAECTVGTCSAIRSYAYQASTQTCVEAPCQAPASNPAGYAGYVVSNPLGTTVTGLGYVSCDTVAGYVDQSGSSAAIASSVMTISSINGNSKTLVATASFASAGFTQGDTVVVGPAQVSAIASSIMTISSVDKTSQTFTATASFIAAGFAVGNTVVAEGANCDIGTSVSFTVTAMSQIAPWTLTVAEVPVADETTANDCTLKRNANTDCDSAGTYTVATVSSSSLTVAEAIGNETTSGDCTIERPPGEKATCGGSLGTTGSYFQFHNCNPRNCKAPSTNAGTWGTQFTVETPSGTTVGAIGTIGCASGYIANGAASYPTSGGLPPKYISTNTPTGWSLGQAGPTASCAGAPASSDTDFVYAGCVQEDTCNSSFAIPTGYVVTTAFTVTSTTTTISALTVVCAAGYESDGVNGPRAACSGGTFTFSGCRGQLCSGSITSAIDGFDYASCTTKRTGEFCVPTCQTGYVASNTAGTGFELMCTPGFTSGATGTLQCDKLCTITALSAPTNGAIAAGCENGALIGSTVTANVAPQPTAAQLAVPNAQLTCVGAIVICNLGYSVQGTGPQCIGTQNFTAGSASCQSNTCNLLDIPVAPDVKGSQRNLAYNTLQQNPSGVTFVTGEAVSQAKLDSGVSTTSFACAAGFELVAFGATATPTFICPSDSGAATISGQMCQPIASTSAECASGSNAATPWCQFMADARNVSGTAAFPSCNAPPTNAGHAWCRCLASMGTAYPSWNPLAVPDADMAYYAMKLGDGHCDSIFDTELCHNDHGDCVAHQSQCQSDLTATVVPACCASTDCATLPDQCSVQCAEAMGTFWGKCKWEPDLDLGSNPSWVWDGLAAECVRTESQAYAACTVPGSGLKSYTLGQKCDANCDCEDCSDEATALACVYPKAPAGGFGLASPALPRCNSGKDVPNTFVCDGVKDCGMGEDETANACAALGVTAQTFFGKTVEPASGNTGCLKRWVDDVLQQSDCTVGSTVQTSSVGTTCRMNLLNWFYDCKRDVLDEEPGWTPTATWTQDNQDTLMQDLAALYVCASAAGAGSCAASTATIAGCDGVTIDSKKLGDGTCNVDLDCAQFGEDGGDCAQFVTANLPFSATGAFSREEFVTAITRGADYIGTGDVAVLSFSQQLTASLQLEGVGINLLQIKAAAAQEQLRNAIAAWLAVSQTSVTLDSTVTATAATLGQGAVNVTYTVQSTQDDVTADFDSRRRLTLPEIYDVVQSADFVATTRRRLAKADLRGALNVAQPQSIPVICPAPTGVTVSCVAGSVLVADLIGANVKTFISISVSVSEAEYELAKGQLTGTDEANMAAMKNDLSAVLMDTTALYSRLQATSGNGLVSVELNGTVTITETVPEGKVVATLTESEAALAVAIILVVIFGSLCGCIIFACCTWHWYKKKQQRKIIVVDKEGKVIKEFEEESENIERMVLQQVLEHYIKEQEDSVNTKYAADIAEAQANLDAYDVIEGEELSWDDTNEASTSGGIADVTGKDLLDAADAEAKSIQKAREAKRECHTVSM